MKKNLFKRGMAGLLSLVMCLTALVGIGTTTAYAAGERAEVYLVSFPRSGDANIDYSGTWGHPNLRYMNGWHSGESKYTTIRAMHSYDGNICYCIEPGVQQDTGDTYTSKDETFWDNLPSDINSTISPYDIKLFIGRIMQYGYTGPISTSWRSQNPADAATLAEAMATQVLIWETVVGERDEDFDYVSPGSYDAVKGVISTAHPLYDLFCDYYDSIEASVQRHSAIPSFMSKNPNRAQSVELEWDGSSYTAMVKTCGSFTEVKKPEHALKLFVRFAIAKGAITYGMELMLALFNIVQGTISTIMGSAGFSTPQQTVLPPELITSVEECGFFESIPLWAVTLIGGLFITVMSFILIMTVYGRFFKLYMYTALAPIPLSTFAGEPSQNVGKSFIKSYCAVCLEGAVIVLSCIIFSLFASSPPVVNPDAAAVTQVWSYVGELLFNMLVLVGSVKMSDRIIREMMGL